MASPLDSTKPSLVPELLIKDKGQMSRDDLKDNSPVAATKFVIHRLRALKPMVGSEVALGLGFGQLTPPTSVSVKERSVESTSYLASWTSWGATSTSTDPAVSDEDLETLIKEREGYYKYAARLHERAQSLFQAVETAHQAITNDLPGLEEAYQKQCKHHEDTQKLANEVLDEYDRLKKTLLKDIQEQDKGLFDHYQRDASDENLFLAVKEHLANTKKGLVEKDREIDRLKQRLDEQSGSSSELRQRDEKIAELSQQLKHSEEQMILALTEQDRMGRVDQWAGKLATDLNEARSRLSLFESALKKSREEKSQQSRRADDLDFRLNQLTVQLREERKSGGKLSELELQNRRLNRELLSAQANFQAATEHLEKFAELEQRNEQLETQTKSQMRDLQRIRGEREQANSKVAAIEGHLRSHSAEMKKVSMAKKEAEAGLSHLKSQIQQLEAKLNSERERAGKLQTDKLSSDSEVRRLRSQFASQVSDARIQASQANIQLHKELEEKKAEFEKERVHYHKLTGQLEALTAQMKKEREKASRYFNTSQKLEQEARLREERLTQLESLKTQLEKQLSRTQAELKTSTGRTTTLEGQLRLQSTELEKLKGKDAELKVSKQHLSQVRAELRETKDLWQKATMAEKSAQEELRKKKDEVRSWVTESKQWNTAKVTLEGQVEALGGKLNKLLSEKQKAETEVSQQSKTVESLRKALQEAETRLRLASSQAKTDQSTQQKEVETLTLQVAELDRLKKKAEEELLASEAKFKEDYSKSEHRVSELTEQLITLKDQLSSVSEAEQRAKSEVAQAKAGCKKFESESVRLGQQAELLTKEVRRLTEEQKQQKKTKMELEKTLVDMKSEMEMLRAKAGKTDAFEQELLQRRKEVSDQKTQLSQMDRELKAQLEDLRQKLDESSRRLHEEEGAKLGMQLDYNTANSQLEQLRSEYATAMAEIDRLKDLTENSGLPPKLGPGFDFQESGVEFEDGGAYVSLSQSVNQPVSLAQPMSTIEETSLTSYQARGPRGVTHFEYENLMRKKDELEQQISDLSEELRISRQTERDQTLRAKQASREVGETKMQLMEVKAENQQLARTESDRTEEAKKLREEVRKLTSDKAQLKIDMQSEVDEANDFAEKTGIRNGELEMEFKHLKSKVDDLEFRLERDMPTVMQESRDLERQNAELEQRNKKLEETNEVFREGLTGIIQLFRAHLPEGGEDDKLLDEKIQAMAAYLLPKQQ